MSDTAPSESIRIFGVRHTDPRNKKEILDRTESPTGPVFHERVDPARENPTFWFIWALVTPSTALRTILAYTGNTGYRSECEKAALALGEREGVEVLYLGRPWLERAMSVFPWHTFVWVPFLYSLTNPLDSIVGGAITLFLIVFGMTVTQPHENRIREAKWAERIDDRLMNINSAVVIVGNDHIVGVARRLSEKGYEVCITSLHNILDG